MKQKAHKCTIKCIFFTKEKEDNITSQAQGLQDQIGPFQFL